MDQKKQVHGALAIVLLVAALLRFYGLNWDQGQHSHPDERWIAMVAPTIAWPPDAADILDPRCSTLNPLWVPDGQGGGQVRNFSYGHLPLYLHSSFGHALAALGRQVFKWGERYQEAAWALQDLGSYGGISLVGRVLSVLCDLGTICLVFLLGKRVYDARVGLLGAALVAFAVTHIQLAHFAAFDAMTAFFITLAVYGAVCVVQAGAENEWPTIGSSIAAGCAIASKFNAAPLVAVLMVAQLIRVARRTDMRERFSPFRVLRGSLVPVLASLFMVLITFFITSPFAILDLRLYLKQISEQGAMVRGQVDLPYTRQYRNTIPFVYQIVQQLRWGLGWPLGIAALAGFGWTILRQFRRPRAEELVMLGWAVPYLALTGTFMVKFMRYMLPLLPLFILMGAAMMDQIGKWANRRGSQTTNGKLPVLRWTDLRSLVSSSLSLIPHIVLACSVLWSLAFTWVYAQEHPWIQASQWIYQNVPDGSVIAVEHWDDHLPLSLPVDRATPAAHGYSHIELPMYEPDGYGKYDLLRSSLREADYIVLSTNRLYRTIPRLPKRYPVSTEFYRLLFAEQLGFVRVAEFTAYPGLFGLRIVDDAADESFTVYDHPKPIVFRKERDLSPVEWDRLFATALATPPVWEFTEERQEGDLLAFLNRDPPKEGEEKKTLLLDVPVGDLPVVADWGWNRPANGSTWGAAVLATASWWLVVTLLGWLAFPVVFAVFRGLRDRGYLLSRAIGLLTVGYLVWLPAALHVLKNGLPLTFAAIAIVALPSSLLLWRYRGEIKAFLRDRWRVILLGEAVFGVAFGAFVGIRLLNPDLWQPWNGGEKGMDIAYLNSCMRSAYLPPFDPYYANGYLNYYYYGQFLISIVTRLTGLTTSVAFNLAVPFYFALTVSHTFVIGYTLAKARNPLSGRDRVSQGVGHGLLAALFVAVLGNLASATQVIERLGSIGQSGFASRIPGLQGLVRAAAGVGQILFHGARFPGFNYWDPSRVVGPTINEFPYWSFLFADLHPHMMNIPFTALVLALALNWLLRKKPDPLGFENPKGLPTSERELVRGSFRYVWQRLDWGEVFNWLLWPLALGALAAINTWDFPAYAGFCGLILLFVWMRERRRQGIVPALLAGVALAAGSLALYYPFFKYYTATAVGLGWGLGRGTTDPGEFLTVWGLTLFLAISFLLTVLGTQRSQWGILRVIRLSMRYLPRLHRLDRAYGLFVRRATPGYRLSAWGIIFLVVLLIFFAWKGYWILALNVPLLLLAAALMSEAHMGNERRFALALVFTSFLILVGIELFYLKDWLGGGDAWRMNTLFKFYLQVWMLLGTAMGASLPWLWQQTERWQAGLRWLWTALFTLLLIAAALFVPLGTPARVLDRFTGDRPPIGTLDGLSFMTVGVYRWPDDSNPIGLRGDYEAIRWLRDTVKGTPVIAECPESYYRAFGMKVASYTGLPSVYGELHQNEQRYGWQTSRRWSQVSDLFMSTSVPETAALIEELRVRYIYIGPLERTRYAQSVGKFAQMSADGYLSVAYQNDSVTIYETVQ